MHHPQSLHYCSVGGVGCNYDNDNNDGDSHYDDAGDDDHDHNFASHILRVLIQSCKFEEINPKTSFCHWFSEVFGPGPFLLHG